MGTLNYNLDENTTIGCGCAACQDGQQPNIIFQGQETADFQGSAVPDFAPNGVADPNVFANYLTHGFWQDTGRSERSWSQDNITFSLNGFTASQQDGLRMAFDLWSDVADIEFTEVGSGANMTLSVGNDGRAYSSSSTSGTTIVSNNISIDTSVYGWSNFNDQGDYALMTALHEIGHSLGLGHTGNYNGSASYGTDAQWTNDTHQTTVMSYFTDTNIGSDHSPDGSGWQYSATPMLIDILAIQNIYGADYTTRSGNTTYGFNSNAGYDQYDFTISEAPIAIWDGGGIDTLDLSGYSTNQTIYLTEGDFSSVGSMTNNLVIAYGAEIENAIGGTGNDSFFANDLDNNIDGNTGTDVINYFYNVTEFAFSFISNTVVALTHIAQNFTDTISNMENFIFADGSFTFNELETSYGDLDIVGVRLFWGGGNYAYNSDENGSLTVTAADMGYAGSTGDQVTIARQAYDTTVTINDSNAPNVIRLYGSDFADTITINGTHNAMIGQIYSGAGDDTVTITVTGDDRIWGEEGDDTIFAGAGNDKIFGGIGDDTIHGEEGNDRLIGGDGFDKLYGGLGDDRLDAGAGNDWVNGDAGNDKLFGYDGDDSMTGGTGADRMYGMTGNDSLDGEEGNDTLIGGDGDDTLVGGAGNDRIEGGNDNDWVEADEGNDRVYGQHGNDTLIGGDGQDYVYGGDGTDYITGDADNDLLYGQDGNDEIYGGTGHDIIEGGADNDYLYGESGIDRLEGGTGNDTLSGGDDNDILFGEDGTDVLYGDAGNDELHGGLNADTLVGGTGIDTLFGEGGSDTFGFTALDGNIDQIHDFTINGGEADILNITDILIGYDSATDDINDFVMLNFKNAGRTDLFINQDGTGSDWEQAAIIRGSDFTGTTIDDLALSNQLITDTTLL